jgi:hypothetical protein
VMALETVASSRADGLTSDERCRVWVAKGVEHDRKMRRRARASRRYLGRGGVVAGDRPASVSRSQVSTSGPPAKEK